MDIAALVHKDDGAHCRSTERIQHHTRAHHILTWLLNAPHAHITHLITHCAPHNPDNVEQVCRQLIKFVTRQGAALSLENVDWQTIAFSARLDVSTCTQIWSWLNTSALTSHDTNISAPQSQISRLSPTQHRRKRQCTAMAHSVQQTPLVHTSQASPASIAAQSSVNPTSSNSISSISNTSSNTHLHTHTMRPSARPTSEPSVVLKSILPVKSCSNSSSSNSNNNSSGSSPLASAELSSGSNGGSDSDNVVSEDDIRAVMSVLRVDTGGAVRKPDWISPRDITLAIAVRTYSANWSKIQAQVDPGLSIVQLKARFGELVQQARAYASISQTDTTSSLHNSQASSSASVSSTYASTAQRSVLHHMLRHNLGSRAQFSNISQLQHDLSRALRAP